jgi:predicted  nucleic acid-binding Zn-ribbon protein
MHKDMDQLHELQQIDSAIAELRADLRALDDGTALRQRIAAAEAELERLTAAHGDDHALQSKKEAELAKAEQKRKDLMAKAYGGTIANPKELETLEKEIESLGRTKDRLENELLPLFDRVDGQTRAVEEQRRAIASLQAALAATVQTHQAEHARITAQTDELRRERERVSGSVDPESLQTYERIRERSANVAVAAVQGRMCSACRVNLPVVQVTRLTRGHEFLKCESCMRLLWIESERDTDTDDTPGSGE